MLPLYSETVTTAPLSRNNKSVKTIWIMIYEQANALGNLLGYLKESEVIDLYNEVFKGGKKIYKVENLNEEFKDYLPYNLVRAISHGEFNFHEPYFKTEIVGEFGQQFTIFVSVDEDDIDFSELAENVFDGRALPQNVEKLFDNIEAVDIYDYELAEYIAKKSGCKIDEALTFARKQNPLSDWFDLYCEFVYTLI